VKHRHLEYPVRDQSVSEAMQMPVFMVVDAGNHVRRLFARRHLKVRCSPHRYYAWHIFPSFAAVVKARRWNILILWSLQNYEMHFSELHEHIPTPKQNSPSPCGIQLLSFPSDRRV